MRYDVIVVGARIAGSSLGMLLARGGLRVLIVDQARFPSDTLSSHQLQPPAVARLADWGLLERLLATGVPPISRVRFSTTGATLDGSYPIRGGVDFMLSPRRTVLDAVLLDAARGAGAEVREATIVEEVTGDDGRVTGIRCRDKGCGGTTTETARLVIGADGRHSRVARAVKAREYHARPASTVSCYTYWSGLPLDVAEMHTLGRHVAGAWPTHDDQVITYAAGPASELDVLRRDPEAHLLRLLDGAGTLGGRARAASRTGPVRVATGLRNVFRQPYGPGWALVGDAGLAMDPITGLGMGHALRDAELAARAVLTAMDGAQPLARSLARYARARDRETKPMFDLTVELARLRPITPPEQRLFAAISQSRSATTEFLGAISGTLPVQQFFTPAKLIRLVGFTGLLQLAAAGVHRHVAQYRTAVARAAGSAERCPTP